MTGQTRFLAALKKLAPPAPPPAGGAAGPVSPDPAGPGCPYGAWLAQRVDYLEARLAWQQRALAGLGLVVALKLLGLQLGVEELMQLVGLVK